MERTTRAPRPSVAQGKGDGIRFVSAREMVRSVMGGKLPAGRGFDAGAARGWEVRVLLLGSLGGREGIVG